MKADPAVQRRLLELAEVDAELTRVQHRRDEALADLDSTEAKRRAEREQLVGELPSDLKALYERVREQRGIGAGLLRGRRCGACQIELDRAALSEVKEAAADDVVRCAECGAVLVRTAESGL